jgi:hypothetical protein
LCELQQLAELVMATVNFRTSITNVKCSCLSECAAACMWHGVLSSLQFETWVETLRKKESIVWTIPGKKRSHHPVIKLEPHTQCVRAAMRNCYQMLHKEEELTCCNDPTGGKYFMNYSNYQSKLRICIVFSHGSLLHHHITSHSMLKM